jgi:uncharacterized membrane protein
MKSKIILFFFLCVITSSHVSLAQCAMCKATVEKGESTKAPIEQRVKGLNNGILYMMSIPYILAGTVAFFWYRNSRKERERKNEIQRIIKSKMSSL